MKVGVIEKMWLYILVVALQFSFGVLTEGEESDCELKFLNSICSIEKIILIVAKQLWGILSVIKFTPLFFSLHVTVSDGRVR